MKPGSTDAPASSLNWVVGHVLASRIRVLDALGQTEGLGVDVALLRSVYGKDSQPDPAQAWALADLLASLDTSQTLLEQGLRAADLDRRVMSPFGEMSLADLADFFAWHEATHVGQVLLLRHLAGED